MLTDEQINALWSIAQGYPQPIKALARAVEREARREALEEAVRVCADMQRGWPSDDHLACAAAIRALIKEPK